MKKIICLLLSIIIIFSFVGCGNTITEGEIYKKEFRKEHSCVMVMPLTISNGKTSSVIMVPYVIYHPDRWVIFIKAFKDNEWKTEDFYVTKDIYENIEIGEMFKYDKDRGDLKDEPCTKTRKEEK